ncbi:hypothetical protein [Streptomyces hirsutus]|uniref:hypothetical protein n=1 Tax=Streptomyces hirsutus TaxID=35620 RepID=UPI003652937F
MSLHGLLDAVVKDTALAEAIAAATDGVNRDPSMPRMSDELECATTLLRRKLWGNTPAG